MPCLITKFYSIGFYSPDSVVRRDKACLVSTKNKTQHEIIIPRNDCESTKNFSYYGKRTFKNYTQRIKECDKCEHVIPSETGGNLCAKGAEFLTGVRNDTDVILSHS
jgi:hypothetical protein